MKIGQYAQGIKDDLISEGILTLTPLPIKGAKSLPRVENFKKLFSALGEKFKFFCSGE